MSFPSIDGPLRPTNTMPALLVQMALYLQRHGLPATERDAIRILSHGPFRLGDVAMLAEEALYAARQGVVAAEISRPHVRRSPQGEAG